MAKRLDLLQGAWKEEAKPAKRNNPEAKVRDEIWKYLQTIGAYVRQINSMGVMRGGRWTTGGQGSGISDLLAWLPDGRHASIEVKAPGKKRNATEDQLRFLRKVIERGHMGCVACSVEDVATMLLSTREEMLAAISALEPRPRKASEEPLFP